MNVPEYQGVLGVMQLVYGEISNSDKRLVWFNEHQKVHRVGKQMLSIKCLSETRWVYHYRCAHALHEYFPSIIDCLEKVIQDKKSLPNQKASCAGYVN